MKAIVSWPYAPQLTYGIYNSLITRILEEDYCYLGKIISLSPELFINSTTLWASLDKPWMKLVCAGDITPHVGHWNTVTTHNIFAAHVNPRPPSNYLLLWWLFLWHYLLEYAHALLWIFRFTLCQVDFGYSARIKPAEILPSTDEPPKEFVDVCFARIAFLACTFRWFKSWEQRTNRVPT